jgi:hypothetical protein
MKKKFTLIIGIFTLAIALLAVGFQVQAANAPADWPGSWQMGPDLDTIMLGCPAGNGFARFSGIYSPQQDRVYFLGGRCENNTTTTGMVFYFDLLTETYHVMYEEMNTPVSNYQVVEITDDQQGHGPGFYIIGGRAAAGTNITDIQVYYPAINTAMTMLDIDDFPGGIYLPGGVVAVDEKIYVFGGFDNSSMYDATYVYDPMQAHGSRWSNTGCNLSTPSAYISTVAVGDKIYAIGGDEYIGGFLVPITDTLVLDTQNLASCWQDDAMADLPQANGDAAAVYVGENYLGGGIFMIGGYWPPPGPYRWVFRYDLAGDTWETFPDLAIPAPSTGRRNQAAVYVPSTSAGPGEGVPGIWTFGGYDGTVSNGMTQSSEWFANPPVYLWNIFLPVTLKP